MKIPHLHDDDVLTFEPSVTEIESHDRPDSGLVHIPIWQSRPKLRTFLPSHVTFASVGPGEGAVVLIPTGFTVERFEHRVLADFADQVYELTWVNARVLLASPHDEAEADMILMEEPITISSDGTSISFHTSNPFFNDTPDTLNAGQPFVVGEPFMVGGTAVDEDPEWVRDDYAPFSIHEDDDGIQTVILKGTGVNVYLNEVGRGLVRSVENTGRIDAYYLKAMGL